MAGTWAVVPVKPFREAKTRLAPALDATARAVLSRQMLARVLSVLVDHPALAGTLVVSRDPAVLDAVEARDAAALLETGQDLNAALRQATRWLRAREAEAVLVVPADVPLLTVADVTAIVSHARDDRCIVIAPCRHAKGTNALLVQPPGALEYAFGPDSFARHVRQAKERGLAVHVYRSASLGLDVDKPEDLAEYRERAAESSPPNPLS